MPSVALKAQLKGFVQSLYDEGMLDHHFDQVQALQDVDNPKFVVEMITLFCTDCERILTELANHLGQPVVDGQKVDAYVHELKGSSTSIGAQHIRLACRSFCQAYENNYKERWTSVLTFSRGLQLVKIKKRRRFE